jgi:uncharacterized RDD family membrane protein YckC
MAASKKTAVPQVPAGVFRRLGAMLYDGLLLTAILMVGSVPPVLLNGGPLRDGTPLAGVKNTFYFLYLLLLIFLFYGWFWTRHSQTLGMAAWRIRVLALDDSLPDWRQVFVRLGTALLGLANLWAWFDPNHRGWHEYLSRTRTIRTPESTQSGNRESVTVFHPEKR